MTERHVLGINETEAPDQFKINPKLQRTRAEGNRQGLTLGSTIVMYPILQDGQIVLPNRAVPQNFKFSPLIKIPPNVIQFLQVPTAKSKGVFNTTTGSVE